MTVSSIVGARLGGRYERDEDRRAERLKDLAIDFFRFLRVEGRGLERRPTLAELLDWLDYLMPQQVSPGEWAMLAAIEGGGDDEQAEHRLISSIGTLLLNKPADQRRAETLLGDWRKSRKSAAKP